MYNWAGKPADYAVQYTYDNLGQLTSADNNLNNAWDIGIGNTISYDPNGNIFDLTRGSTTKTYSYYPGTNKVKNTGGAGNDYGYDWNANVYYATPKSILDIDYDSFTQRPTSIYLTGSRSLTLQYGGATQRVLKNYNDGSVTNSKLYLHGQNDYPLIEKDKTSAAAENLTLYIYGLNGAIAKRAGSTVLFLLKDHLGSTRALMDATGLVHTYYDYDALGNLIRTGTTNEVTYQFTGQEYDESGLHNYRARLYDSDLGKFYAVDPDGEFASPFIYAGNNALRYTDPTGRFSFVPLLFYAAYAAGNAAIDKEHMGLAALKSAGLSLASQGVSTVAHPIIGNYFLAQGFSGGITSGVQASMRNGSFGKGFAQGFIQSFALAAIQGEPQYREESSFGEKLNNLFRFRGWREDTFAEDFAEQDYGNFATRVSKAMGFDLNKLQNKRIEYNPSLSGGMARPVSNGLWKIAIGNADGPTWLATLANGANTLVHEWEHVIRNPEGTKWSYDFPWALHERDVIRAQMSHISYQFTTPEYKQLIWQVMKQTTLDYYLRSGIDHSSAINILIYSYEKEGWP